MKKKKTYLGSKKSLAAKAGVAVVLPPGLQEIRLSGFFQIPKSTLEI